MSDVEETACEGGGGGGGGGGEVVGDEALHPPVGTGCSDIRRPEGNPENIDSVQMEEFIDKILEKYGEPPMTTRQKPSSVHPTNNKSEKEVKRSADYSADYSAVNSNRGKDASNSVEEDEEEEEESRATAERLRRRQMLEWGQKGEEEEEEEKEAIGSVIRSQKGVAEQLMNVSEGLNEVSEDLEAMKKELERVQLNAYAVQLSSLFGGETMRDVIASTTTTAAAAAAATGTTAAEHQQENRRTPKKNKQQQGNDSRRQDKPNDNARHADRYAYLYTDKCTDRYQEMGSNRGSALEEVSARETTGCQWNRQWNSWTDQENSGQTESRWRETPKHRQTDRQTDRQTVRGGWNAWVNETSPRLAERSCNKNEWTEEREGILRLGQESDVLLLERQRPLPSDIPWSGREYSSCYSSRESDDDEMTQLLARTKAPWKIKTREEEEKEEETNIRPEGFRRTWTTARSASSTPLRSDQASIGGHRHMRGEETEYDGVGGGGVGRPPSFYTDIISPSFSSPYSSSSSFFSSIGRRRSSSISEDYSGRIRREYEPHLATAGAADRTSAMIIQTPNATDVNACYWPSLTAAWRLSALQQQQQQQQQQHPPLSSSYSSLTRQPLIRRSAEFKGSRYSDEGSSSSYRRNSVEGL